MAITELKLRRGTTTDHQSFTGAEGEITIDTSKDTLVVHDGTTVGGHPLAKASQPRGWTQTEHFTADGTWTKVGKADLKRIKVTVFGGGGGASSSTSGGGGGSGGHGYVILDVANVTDNVAVGIGAGAVENADGGATTFGSYITANGGLRGTVADTYNGQGGAGGTVTGTNTIDLGGWHGENGNYAGTAGSNHGAVGGGGGGPGGGAEAANAYGVCGGGGGAANGDGADGSVLIEEIYGEV